MSLSSVLCVYDIYRRGSSQQSSMNGNDCVQNLLEFTDIPMITGTKRSLRMSIEETFTLGLIQLHTDWFYNAAWDNLESSEHLCRAHRSDAQTMGSLHPPGVTAGGQPGYRHKIKWNYMSMSQAPHFFSSISHIVTATSVINKTSWDEEIKLISNPA